MTINGIEAGAQIRVRLPAGTFKGFGALANMTYPKDKGFKGTNVLTGEILPFPGLSRTQLQRLAVLRKRAFSVRASYNWRESG